MITKEKDDVESWRKYFRSEQDEIELVYNEQNSEHKDIAYIPQVN